MDHVQIFDTTLRDGEQSPGFSMNREEKLQLARQIEQLGVDIIEAGFPIASPGDLDATRAVAAEIKHCRVAALARAKQDDVEAALRGLEPAAKPRLHVFLATSDLHLKYKLRTTRELALEQIAKMVRFGRQNCEEVEFSAEDASRTDIEYLCQVVLAAVESGATIINLPDTVGYSTPDDYGEMFRKVRARLGAHPDVVLSAHCHDAVSYTHLSPSPSRFAPPFPPTKRFSSRFLRSNSQWSSRPPILCSIPIRRAPSTRSAPN